MMDRVKCKNNLCKSSTSLKVITKSEQLNVAIFEGY